MKTKMQIKLTTTDYLIFILFFLYAGVAVSENNSLSLPDYHPLKLEDKISLSSVGSDSMQGVMEAFVESYYKVQPDLNINLVNRGSSLAPAALLDGSARLGQMSRDMKTNEKEIFLNKFGFEPTRLKTALAATLVYTSSENPLNEISLKELDAIYSAERLRGALSSLDKWGDLLALENKKSSIDNLLIRPYIPATGTPVRAYFKQKALLQSDFNSKALSYANLEDAFKQIKNDSSAILVGPYTKTLPHGVKALSVKNAAKQGESPAVKPSLENIYSLDYPLSRYLNIYTVFDTRLGARARLGQAEKEKGSIMTKNKPLVLERSTKDFLSFILSKQGQEVVKEEGLIPLSPEILQEQIELIK